MTYPDDVMKAAREVSANDWAETGCTSEAAEIRSGEYTPHEIELIARAIMAERQRCARISKHFTGSLWPRQVNDAARAITADIERGDHV